MSSRITRMSRFKTGLDLTAVLSTTGVIDMRDSAGGMLYIANGVSKTLTYHAAPEPSGTYEPLFDKNGNAVTLVVTGDEAFPIHEAAFGAGAIKLVLDATTATIAYSLKG